MFEYLFIAFIIILASLLGLTKDAWRRHEKSIHQPKFKNNILVKN